MIEGIRLFFPIEKKERTSQMNSTRVPIRIQSVVFIDCECSGQIKWSVYL